MGFFFYISSIISNVIVICYLKFEGLNQRKKMNSKKTPAGKNTLVFNYSAANRGVFSILSKTYDGEFLWKQLTKIKDVNYFREKLHFRWFAEF